VTLAERIAAPGQKRLLTLDGGGIRGLITIEVLAHVEETLSAVYPRERWAGDDFVVETAGFNDKGWLDNAGHPNTARLRVTERFRRKDFGHMDIDITIDDPGAYMKPWTVTLPLLYQADTELLEYICSENNRYFEIVPKK